MTDHSTRLFRALSGLKVSDPSLLHTRMSWFNRREIKCDPVFAQLMTDEEIGHITDWYRETNDAPFVGDSGIVSMSLISDLILTNGITNAVQLGHYAGFGSMVMGFILRKVSPSARLISFDIDAKMNRYCEEWMQRVGLAETVCHICADSTDPLTFEMAATHLTGNPQLIFIDASKQYENTKQELTGWSRHINGYIVCHDTSLVAKGVQANGILGVSDGMNDSGLFTSNELLLIDPKCEKDDSFPYQDPCGLGVGVSRGTEPLPKPRASIEQMKGSRLILDTSKLRFSEHWFCDKGWAFSPGQLRKSPDADGWAWCFAPIEPGETLEVEVRVRDFKGGDIMACAGGHPGTVLTFQGDGLHRGRIQAGGDNSRVALYATAASDFVVDNFSVISTVGAPSVLATAT